MLNQERAPNASSRGTQRMDITNPDGRFPLLSLKTDSGAIELRPGGLVTNSRHAANESQRISSKKWRTLDFGSSPSAILPVPSVRIFFAASEDWLLRLRNDFR